MRIAGDPDVADPVIAGIVDVAMHPQCGPVRLDGGGHVRYVGGVTGSFRYFDRTEFQ